MMEIRTHFCDQQTAVAAATIERKVTECAQNAGMAVFSSHWNAGQAIYQSGLYRLNVCIGGKTARIYFTDHELASYCNGQSTHATDIRLERVIEELHEDGLSPVFLSTVQRIRSLGEKF